MGIEIDQGEFFFKVIIDDVTKIHSTLVNSSPICPQ